MMLLRTPWDQRFRGADALETWFTPTIPPDADAQNLPRRAVQIVANALSLRAWLKDTKTVLGNICGNRFQALDSDSDSECESV